MCLEDLLLAVCVFEVCLCSLMLMGKKKKSEQRNRGGFYIQDSSIPLPPTLSPLCVFSN